MKIKKIMIQSTCLVLAAALVGSTAASAALYSAPAKSDEMLTYNTEDVNENDTDTDENSTTEAKGIKKSETVFINLDAAGKPYKTIVTDNIHSDAADIEITDKSDLSDIVNIKGNEKPQQNGNELKWKLEGNDLYYQGNSDKEHPVEVNVSYSLDGKTMTAEEIAGKSGKAEIKLSFKNKSVHTAIINGKESTLYTPFLAVAALSMPDDTFSNVKVSKGTVIKDGNSCAVSIICLPGLKDSLGLGSYSMEKLNDIDLPEEFVITADAKEFNLGPIGIAMTSEIPNLDDLKDTEDIDDMRKDLNDLSRMQDDFETIDPDKKIRSLFTDAERVKGAQTLIDDIYRFYDLDTEMFETLPDYITKDNMRMMEHVSETLDKMDVKGLLSIINQIDTQKLNNLYYDYKMLNSTEMQPAMTALHNLIVKVDEINKLMNDATELLVLTQTNAEDIKTLNTLAGLTPDIMALVNAFESAGIKSLTKVDLEVMVKALLENRAKPKSISADVPAPIPDTPPLTNNDAVEKIPEQQSSAPENNPNPEAPKVAEPESSTSNTAAQEKPQQSSESVNSAPPETIKTADSQIPAASAGVAAPEAQKEVAELQPDNNAISTEKPAEAVSAGNETQPLSGAANLDQQAKVIADKIWAIISSAKAAGITPEKMASSVKFIQTVMPKVNNLLLDASTCSKEILNVAKVLKTQEFADFQAVLTKDINENKQNFALIAQLGKCAKKDDIESLLGDLEYASPYIQGFANELHDSRNRGSLHDLPYTTKVLLDIRSHLFEYRNICDTLKITVKDENVSKTKKTIETLDRLKDKDALGSALGKMDDADILLARKDKMIKLSESYTAFTAADESMDTSVKFIMKTDEIKKPEAPIAEAPKEKKKEGFFDWLAGLFKKSK